MVVHARSPGPPLDRFVEALWAQEAPPAPHARERCLPTGTLELVVNLREDEIRLWERDDPTRCRTLPGAVICGAHSRWFVIDTDEVTSVAGAHFRPGGAHAFLGLPADEVRDLHVPLDELWGRAAASELRERMLAAASMDACLRTLEAFLLSRTAGREGHAAVPYAVRALGRGDAPVGEVAERAGLSHRRFSEVFRREVGLTPKTFGRVLRFQRVLDRLERPGPVRWADLAVACGYFDQAHLIHDVREITGLTPGELLAQRGPQRNHVPLPLEA